MGTNINLAVLAGTITSDPIRRDLKGGVSVIQFDVATVVDDSTVTAPIAWYDPTDAQASSIGSGASVVVVGSVRRRFFRAGGQTQSRTEVVASTAIPSRRKKSVASALAAAAAGLTRADG